MNPAMPANTESANLWLEYVDNAREHGKGHYCRLKNNGSNFPVSDTIDYLKAKYPSLHKEDIWEIIGAAQIHWCQVFGTDEPDVENL